MRYTVEMTLTADTARMLAQTAKRIAKMNLGKDGLIAATVLLRIAADYQRAVEAAGGEFNTREGPSASG